MEKHGDQIEVEEGEVTQASKKPPTQIVLGASLAAVIALFVIFALYWWV